MDFEWSRPTRVVFSDSVCGLHQTVVELGVGDLQTRASRARVGSQFGGRSAQAGALSGVGIVGTARIFPDVDRDVRREDEPDAKDNKRRSAAGKASSPTRIGHGNGGEIFLLPV
jgi:hypothetical protein